MNTILLAFFMAFFCRAAGSYADEIVRLSDERIVEIFKQFNATSYEEREEARALLFKVYDEDTMQRIFDRAAKNCRAIESEVFPEIRMRSCRLYKSFIYDVQTSRHHIAKISLMKTEDGKKFVEDFTYKLDIERVAIARMKNLGAKFSYTQEATYQGRHVTIDEDWRGTSADLELLRFVRLKKMTIARPLEIFQGSKLASWQFPDMIQSLDFTRVNLTAESARHVANFFPAGTEFSFEFYYCTLPRSPEAFAQLIKAFQYRTKPYEVSVRISGWDNDLLPNKFFIQVNKVGRKETNFYVHSQTVPNVNFGIATISNYQSLGAVLHAEKGRIITGVIELSGAGHLNLKYGDVLLRINERDCSDRRLFQQTIWGLKVGEPVTVQYIEQATGKVKETSFKPLPYEKSRF